jgi:hypothetical protein
MTVLRPEYTELLAKELNKQSVNIYGESGQGQWRLLEDLKELLSHENRLVFLLNMKSYAASYQGFIADISGQLKQQSPAAKEKTIADLAQFLTVFDEYATSQYMVLLLHNFDALLDNPQLDEAYDVNFFNALNALRNSGHRLLCITVKPHNQSQVFVKQQVHSNSWLDLKRMALPALTETQIKDELIRQDLSLTREQLRQLIDAIQQHNHPYDFLEFAIDQLHLNDNAALTLNKRLKKWQKEFNNTEKSTVFKDLHGVSNWMKKLGIITGIDKLKTPFVLAIELAEKFIGKPN